MTLTKKMKVTKTKKTCLVRKSVKPAFNQSFDFQLEESCVNTFTITLELRQQRAFAVKGRDLHLYKENIVPPVKVLTSLCLVLPTTKNKITISQSK